MWRGAGIHVRMVAQIPIHRLIAENELESALRGDVDGFLQVELAEINHVLDGLRAAFAGGEVELIIDEPVVEDVVNGAVLEIKLGELAFGATV